MRLAVVFATLALAALPLRAQQVGPAAGDSASPGAEEYGAAHAEQGGGNAALSAEWKKIVEHWKLVETVPVESRAEHVEMHRTMLGGFMQRLAEHAGEQPPSGASRQRVAEMREEQEDLQEHWVVVQKIRDPDQLRTHLALHMQMLESLRSEGEDVGVHAGQEGMEHEGMDHEGMEDEGMDHEAMGHDEADEGPDSDEGEESMDPDEGMNHDEMHGDEGEEGDEAEDREDAGALGQPEKPAGY